MKNLWAPWRLEYILGPKADQCLFCLPANVDQDRKRLVLTRGEHCFVLMNRFPYSNGHLMTAPYRHVRCLIELDSNEASEMMGLIQLCTSILKKAFNPDGINIGLNIGEAAGAGIEEHLHFHLVPRWVGDFSFMAVMSETSVIPEHLLTAYDRLKAHFKTYT
ncbi:HIT domain-containing protein [Desulfonatronospira sp.]|uniref:HIT family protein n=1 Tax=Desulfonatronospira sp. TaxID=1962951 RepID=UPI0025C4BF9E|nr:HIT domain-containing protein [Desulfonatronospira sp.]